MVRMELTPYIDRLRHDLVQTAAGGSDQLRDAAERLALALDPALRLAMMEALAQATAEITTEMRTGSVEVRLAGRDLEFVVEQHRGDVPAATAPADTEEDEDEEAATARITLRLPESVKTRAEQQANRSGQSLNTWIVGVLRAATRDRSVNIDIDLSSLPFFGPGDDHPGRRSRRMTGWV